METREWYGDRRIGGRIGRFQKDRSVPEGSVGSRCNMDERIAEIMGVGQGKGSTHKGSGTRGWDPGLNGRVQEGE